MKTGTASVLIGAHQFIIHPLFVAAAWTQLYGPPRDPRLWAAFFVHDIGYLGLPDMDSPESEAHVETGARIMRAFGQEWSDFSLLHSRFYAKRLGRQPSRLCPADKLSVALEPWWLYLPRVIASGEVWEYLHLATQASKYTGEPHVGHTNIDITPEEIQARTLTVRTWRAMRQWHGRMCRYLRAWATEHADGRADSWTPGAAQ